MVASRAARRASLATSPHVRRAQSSRAAVPSAMAASRTARRASPAPSPRARCASRASSRAARVARGGSRPAPDLATAALTMPRTPPASYA
ncbi:hypothetical protein ABZP36_018543 [Zizania latifolia]